MRAIIALAVLVGCAETETTEAETETTETTEQTAVEAFEEAADRVEENFGDENIIETPAKTTDTIESNSSTSSESAVSSD